MKKETKKTSLKFLKQILTDSKMTAKWRNCGTWQTETYKNLMDAANHCGIKILSQEDGFIKLTMKTGCMSVSMKTTFSDFERYLVKLIKIHSIYLGDKAKFITRFGTSKINY